MSWGRWTDDVQHNKKLRAISPAARWLYFSVAQECRAGERSAFYREDLSHNDGRVTRKAAEAFARDQGCDVKLIHELLVDHYERPLWHREGEFYVIHDFHDTDPPASWRSNERVNRHRAAKRDAAVTVTPPRRPPLSPSPTPPSPLTPQATSARDLAEPLDSSTRDERAAAVSEWWNAKTGEYALARDIDKVAALEIPIEKLVEHLDAAAMEAVRRGDPIGSLHYFTGGRGMGKLRELESENRDRGDGLRTRGRHAGAHRAGEVLSRKRYRAATASTTSATEEAG